MMNLNYVVQTGLVVGLGAVMFSGCTSPSPGYSDDDAEETAAEGYGGSGDDASVTGTSVTGDSGGDASATGTGVTGGSGDSGDDASATGTGATGDSGDTTGDSTSCDPPLIEYNGSCVDPFTDATHCGGCDVECGEGSCQDGVCESADCGEELTWCDDSLSCEDLSVGPTSCGACGNDCAADLACVGGQCIPCDGGACEDACESLGLAFCGSNLGCRDLMNEREHCGECDRDCNDEFPKISSPDWGPENHDLTCVQGVCFDGDAVSGTPCEPASEYSVCSVTNCGTYPWLFECRGPYCGGGCTGCPAHHTCVNDECVFEDPCGEGFEACCYGTTDYDPCVFEPPPFDCNCCDAQSEICVEFPNWASCMPQ